ncbi:MAG: hypothetical protein A2687_04105 [Candidatus Levybacteria bacterium RIFCSPHIGHO2_01_FULL_38_26]|nr:MAG: hypothetical protein A2687_04105 [Candidatus Levybacteria bacterium RIFCSPHIGHO2_01_FULL_38_26]
MLEGEKATDPQEAARLENQILQTKKMMELVRIRIIQSPYFSYTELFQDPNGGFEERIIDVKDLDVLVHTYLKLIDNQNEANRNRNAIGTEKVLFTKNS